MCDALKVSNFVVPGSVDCWLDDFKLYLTAQQQEFPVPNEESFMSLLMTWMSTETVGKKAKQDKKIGIVGSKLIYTEIKAQAKVLRNDEYKVKKPEYQKWLDFVEQWRNKAPIAMRSLQ